MFKRRLSAAVVLGALWLHILPATAQGAKPDFSGTWKKDNAQSTSIRPGTVTMKIEQHDPQLKVEMIVARPMDPERRSVQDYTTDGKESVSTGADGDKFYTKVVWQNGALVFNVEEHEDGRVLHSTETWTLSPDGQTITRLRHTERDEQRILYVRQR
ncbi:MAG TPA: hypothetical protein VKV02_08030 [Acidobacteriaceae bacterium]|nr:hypothetical protein [Acidobacteriaceae bacterium]